MQAEVVLKGMKAPPEIIASNHAIQQLAVDILRQESDDHIAFRKIREGARDKAKEDEIKKAEKEDKGKKEGTSKGDELLKEAEEIKKGLALLDRFPAEQFSLKGIADKNVRKQPITVEEREFMDDENQRLMNKARTFQAAEKKIEEKASETKETKETPTGENKEKP